MEKENKAAVVTTMHEKFSRARIAVVTECTGMQVNQVTKLRKQLREAQSQMHVVKNTLAARALQDTPLVPIEPLLKGQLAMIIGYDDPVLPAKVLRDFIKSERCEDKMRLKGGVLDGASLTPERITAVADLPSKNELLSMFLSALQGPIRGFVVGLNQIIRGIVAVLAAIQESKGQKGEAEMAVESKLSKEDIINGVASMSVLELSELVKELEEKFGVTAAAPVGVVAAPAAAAPAAEEKDSFDVVLASAPADKKIQVIKVVREITGLGLKEAKDLVEGAPKAVKEGVAKEESETLKKKLARCWGHGGSEIEFAYQAIEMEDVIFHLLDTFKGLLVLRSK